MNNTPDHARLFRVSPYPYLVMDCDLVIIDANDAYLRTMGRTMESLLGWYVFDAFPENPHDPDSTNHSEVKVSLETAIATGRPHTSAFLRYSIPKPSAGGNIFEERYWSAVHTPALDDDGRVLFVIQNAIDVTDLYRFDKTALTASVKLDPPESAGTENFNRAQMHEAMTRILRDERGHLRNLFNQAPGFVAVLTGPRHVFEMVNEAYYQLVGHRDIIGKPLWDALPEVAGQGYEALLTKVYSTGESWLGRAMPIAVQQTAGGPIVQRYIDISYQPYRAEDGGVLGIFAQGYDVTEAVEAQAARNESEERLQEGMLAAKMVVWDWEVASRKMVFSDNVMEVLGRTADSIDALHESIAPEDSERLVAAHARAFADGGDYREVVHFCRPDNGKMIWLDVRGKVRRDAVGKPLAVRGVTLDVTERIHAEEELRLADRRKDEFLAMLAHELRNPLAPISSAAQLMKMTTLDQASLKQTSDIIARQISHMTGLIDDLIDVSRVTRGLIVTDRKPLDMKRIVSDALEQIGPVLEARRHHLRLELPSVSTRVLGDEKRLVQVLTNILSNAAKYTPPGGNIALVMDADAEHVRITVSDDGIGISPDLLPRVFDLFAQAERSSDRSQGGLGIGLALVKSLVDLHRGQVSIQSEGLGRGTQFLISLQRLHGEAWGGSGQQQDFGRQPGQRSLRVMIVDDNEDAAQMLGMFLEAAGHAVRIEHGALAALANARADAPDLFLLDIGLPEMDGNELARQLRADPATAKAMIIAVTGYGQAQDRERTRDAGFDHHLVKPVDPAVLMTLLATLTQGTSRPAMD